jgi:hypothetical protein
MMDLGIDQVLEVRPKRDYVPFLPKAGVEALAVGCLLLWMALMSIRMLWHHPVR